MIRFYTGSCNLNTVIVSISLVGYKVKVFVTFIILCSDFIGMNLIYIGMQIGGQQLQ